MTCTATETIQTSVGVFFLIQREHGVIDILMRDAGCWRKVASRRTWERAEEYAYRYGQEVTR